MAAAEMAKRALIVGISGQDGSYLADLLLRRGYEVLGTSRDAQVARFANLTKLGIFPKVKIDSMNPADFRSVFEVLSKWKPDEIYNLSGQSSVGLSFQQPVDAINSIVNVTVVLLEAVRFLGFPARLYNAGSSECFGDVRYGMANEDTPFRPRSPYATAKSAAHWTVANYREGYGLFACTGILFNHESPLRPERFVTRKITVAASQIASGLRKRLTLGNLDVRRDWGWAPEYVEAMWRMLQLDQPQDFVIATGKLSSLQEFAEAAFRAVGLDWHEYIVLDPALRRPTDLEGFAGDASRARELLGWQPRLVMPEIATVMVKEEIRSPGLDPIPESDAATSA